MATGWYRLPGSGVLYHGPLPEGVEALEGPVPVVESPGPPARSAPKAAWVQWATQVGWAPEDAQAKTKAELIDEVGSVGTDEQIVDTSKDPGPVGPEVPGDDLGPDGQQVGTAPVAPTGDESLDGDVEGHEG